MDSDNGCEDVLPDAEVVGDRLLVLFDRQLAKVENLTALISGISIFGLMLFAIANIGLRKIFNYPIFGYIDVVEVTMILFAVLAISQCQRLAGHVRMELVLNALKGRVLWTSEALASLVAIAVTAVLIRYSWDYFLNAYINGDSTIDAEISTWPAKLVVPVAMTILLARLLLQFWGYLRLVVDPEREPLAVPMIESVTEQAKHEIEGAGVVVGDE